MLAQLHGCDDRRLPRHRRARRPHAQAPRRREDRQLRLRDLLRARRGHGRHPRRLDVARAGTRRWSSVSPCDAAARRSPGARLPCCGSPLRSTGRGVVNPVHGTSPASSQSSRSPLSAAARPARPRARRSTRPTRPKAGALYANGQNGRYLMGGQWLFRAGPAGPGPQPGVAAPGLHDRLVVHDGAERLERRPTQSEASMHGGVGWYRKDFKLPSSAEQLSWVIRFESVNYRVARVAQRQAARAPTRAPTCRSRSSSRPRRSSAAAPTGSSSASTRAARARTSRPPATTSRAARSAAGGTTAASCARSTCAASQGSDFSAVQVRPVLPCSTCAATMRFRALVRNAARGAADPRHAALRRRSRSTSGRGPSAAARRAEFTGSLRVANPKLWSPDSPTALPGRRSTAGGGARNAGDGPASARSASPAATCCSTAAR